MCVCVRYLIYLFVFRKCRFDRLYLWMTESNPFNLKALSLVGTSVIDEVNLSMHPSDHFGLLVNFQKMIL